VGWLLALPKKYWTRLQSFTMDKHSRLFYPVKKKVFENIETRGQYIKLFTAVIYGFS